MRHAGFLLSLLLGVGPIDLRAAEEHQPPGRPNIIVVLADDTGLSRIGCYGGGPFETPCLDRLAATGLRFERAYSMPICGPSRAALLTGKYPFRTGATVNDNSIIDPREHPTLPLLLKQAGYATCAIGKLGQIAAAADVKAAGRLGFDESMLWLGRHTPDRYWSPRYHRNGEVVQGEASEYGPDLTHDFLVDFMKRHRDTPFFAFYSAVLTHFPFGRTPDSKDDGHFVEDMVAYLDKQMGRLAADLDSLGLRDNTIIIFTSDNGPQGDPLGTIGGRPMVGGKGDVTEGGVRTPLIVNCPRLVPHGRVCGDLTDFTDLLPTVLELAGVEPPDGVVIDGRSIAPQILGREGRPREWIYAQHGPRYFIADHRHKLYEDGRLVDIVDSPVSENPIPAMDEAAIGARDRLTATLRQLRSGEGEPPRGRMSRPASHTSAEAGRHDVVVYGGSAAGIAAAVQVRRQGGSVVVIEPGGRIGGLTTGGLGQTDIGNKQAIGGIALEFYRRVRKHYDDPARWRWQTREAYRDDGQTRTSAEERAMWTFEPSAALAILQGLIREHDVLVVLRERLDRTGGGPGRVARGVEKAAGRIVAIRTESGRTFRGRMFIDATYEGDLMAAAGVSYAIGREAITDYGESLNGVQTQNARTHLLAGGVDPHVRKGDPTSGLLPGIDADGPGEEGSGDRRLQAYCFRMCLTDHPENRIPFAKPAGYDPLDHELLLRNFEAGEAGMPWINSPMPNRKTDTNNRTGVSTDFIGGNYAYPEADDAERERIVARHLTWQQGLMWTLANHERVPERIRCEVARWGVCRDEFVESGGWPEQLYIREARRMVGETIMTQHHCQGREVAPRPVGMAAYTMDSHHVQRYVDPTGHVQNEGCVEVGGFPPYPVDAGAIVPRRAECTNLVVPVCVSATHIAYGSIRMEPVFMVLGQSAASLALEAIRAGVPVQEVDYERLRSRLEADGQVLGKP